MAPSPPPPWTRQGNKAASGTTLRAKLSSFANVLRRRRAPRKLTYSPAWNLSSESYEARLAKLRRVGSYSPTATLATIGDRLTFDTDSEAYSAVPSFYDSDDSGNRGNRNPRYVYHTPPRTPLSPRSIQYEDEDPYAPQESVEGLNGPEPLLNFNAGTFRTFASSSSTLLLETEKQREERVSPGPSPGTERLIHTSHFPLHLLSASEDEPVLDWYGALVTIATLGLGTWKLVATCANKDATGVAVVDWAMSVILGLIFFWLDRLRGRVRWLRWLSRRDALLDMWACGFALVVTIRRLYRWWTGINAPADSAHEHRLGHQNLAAKPCSTYEFTYASTFSSHPSTAMAPADTSRDGLGVDHPCRLSAPPPVLLSASSSHRTHPNATLGVLSPQYGVAHFLEPEQAPYQLCSDDAAAQEDLPTLPPLPIHALSLGNLTYQDQMLDMPEPTIPVPRSESASPILWPLVDGPTGGNPRSILSLSEPEPDLADTPGDAGTPRTDDDNPAIMAISTGTGAACRTDTHVPVIEEDRLNATWKASLQASTPLRRHPLGSVNVEARLAGDGKQKKKIFARLAGLKHVQKPFRRGSMALERT